MCDLVAEYHGIERARIEVTENSDGSFTSRLKGEGAHTQKHLAVLVVFLEVSVLEAN